MPRIIQRYIRNEILSSFTLSVSVFTLALFMQNALGLSDMIITRNVKLINLLLIVLYTLPSLLWFSIPMAFLMASLTGIGRLSMDNEIIAMHSLGIGTLSFLRPVLILGCILFTLSFSIGSVGVPWGRSSMNHLIYRILQESATAGIQANTFNDRFTDLVIYAENVKPEENTLQKVIIADYRGDVPETITALEGTIRTNPLTMVNTLQLTRGSVHQYDSEQQRYRLIQFQEYTVSLSTDVEASRQLSLMQEKEPDEMTPSELRKAAATGNPAQTRVFRIHYQEKFSLPFSCIVFGIFSIPISIRLKKSGSFIGLSWSLLIVFLYYILLGAGRKLGSEGFIHPILAAWLPNTVFGMSGIYLLVNASRKIPAGRGGNDSGLSQIRKKIMKVFGH
ncbi:MAG: LPS export ABC transporter permease LptF [bacterium]